MRIQAKICRAISKKFPLPVHPFNLNNDGVMSYAQWQYTKGADTLNFFVPFSSKEDMFLGKTVLDLGCGAAGKTLYYATLGAAKVYGAEILKKYRAEAEALASQLGLTDVFEFVTADSAAMPFPDSSIDTIIMNDTMEHVARPEATLRECLRVLRPGQRIYINFPPYYHPYGAHLSDAIGIPWVHVLFSEAALIEVYKDAIKHLPDADERLAFRVSKGDGECLSYINRMTIRRFRNILQGLGIHPAYYREVPLRKITTPLARLPILKEGFVKMVVCIIEKPS